MMAERDVVDLRKPHQFECEVVFIATPEKAKEFREMVTALSKEHWRVAPKLTDEGPFRRGPEHRFTLRAISSSERYVSPSRLMALCKRAQCMFKEATQTIARAK